MHFIAWQAFYIFCRRLLACVAGFVMLYIEVSGSLATRQALYGVCHSAQFSNAYKSSLISTVLTQLLTNATFWPAIQAATTRPELSVLYFDIPTDTLTLSFDSCQEFRLSDLMYNKSYLEPLLHTILDNQHWHNINLSDHYVIIDCQYGGRLLNDTTALKIYLLDPSLTNITTVNLQTMMLVRPAIFMTEASGLVNVMVASLKELSIVEGAIQTTQTAHYHHLLGIEFPYVMDPFVPIQLLNPTLPSDATWKAIITKSNESVKILGTDGVYRQSPQMQGNYDYYNWVLPDNPVDFITRLEYYVAPCTADCYAWVRSLLGMGVAFNLGVNIFVALVIVINSWFCHREIWVPDFYPSIQRRIQLRSMMLIMVSYSNNWWHVFEYALQKGNVRTGWSEGFVLDEMIRSDCLTYLLSIALTLADLFHQRLGLDILMLIYTACWSYQDDLVVLLGWDIATTDAYLEANYMDCIIPPEVGNPMTLWVYHENFSTPNFLLKTQFSWFFVAILLTVGYAVGTMLYSKFSHDICNRKYRTLFQTNKIHVQPKDYKSLLAPSSQNYHNWTRTVFEKNSCQILANTFGIIAPFNATEGKSAASPSAIWLLGYFLLNDAYVVQIRDYVKIWINCLFRIRIFYVYCFMLNDDDTISPYKQDLPLKDVHAQDLLLRISLRTLR